MHIPFNNEFGQPQSFPNEHQCVIKLLMNPMPLLVCFVFVVRFAQNYSNCLCASKKDLQFYRKSDTCIFENKLCLRWQQWFFWQFHSSNVIAKSGSESRKQAYPWIQSKYNSQAATHTLATHRPDKDDSQRCPVIGAHSQMDGVKNVMCKIVQRDEASKMRVFLQLHAFRRKTKTGSPWTRFICVWGVRFILFSPFHPRFFDGVFSSNLFISRI